MNKVFFESALIVDDKKDEVENLIKILEKNGIASTFFEYTEEKNIKSNIVYKNRKIIFMDLFLTDKPDPETNMSNIRRFLQKHIGKDFGPYGIVLWTNHSENKDIFIEKINEDKKDNSYTMPLFVVCIDKSKYLPPNSFRALFKDIENELNSNHASVFFLEWSGSVFKGLGKTLSSFYDLIPDYGNPNYFLFLFKKLALNYNGIPQDNDEYNLYMDAYKSFDDILHAEILNCHLGSKDIFKNKTEQFPEPDNIDEIYARINKLLLIEDDNLNQEFVIPGNVYEIKNGKNKFNVLEFPTHENVNIEKHIAIELTPPCDFSCGKKIISRLIRGVIYSINDKSKVNIKNVKNKLLNKDYYYKEFWPVYMDSWIKIITFDFRYLYEETDDNLKNKNKYKLIFRVKPKLFADILQKFSSYSSRLGLSVMRR